MKRMKNKFRTVTDTKSLVEKIDKVYGVRPEIVQLEQYQYMLSMEFVDIHCRTRGELHTALKVILAMAPYILAR